jgi:hypothetical protein
MTAVDREIEIETAHIDPETVPATQPPYMVGDRVQILYMSARGTILADANVTAVFPREDGSYGVNAVMSDARASFHLVPADRPARAIQAAPDPRPGRVIYGVDHTKPTE